MPKKHKLVIYWLHSHFLLSTGGTRYLFEVISRLAKIYDIRVIVEKTTQEWKNKYHCADVEVIENIPLSSNSLFYWLTFPFWFGIHMLKIPRQTKNADLIVSSMFPMNAIAALNTKPTVNICFEPFAFFYDRDLIGSFTTMHKFFLKILRVALSPLDKWAMKKQTTIATLNESGFAFFRTIYDRSPDAVTYLGIDQKIFYPNKKKNITQNCIFFHSTDFTSLKGTDFMFQSFAKAVKRSPHIELWISESIENAEQKQKLTALAKKFNIDKQIRWLGHVTISQLAETYRNVDVYCFTGRPKSGSSMSIIEAQACGLPIIKLKTGTNEIIDSQNGLVVSSHDADSFAKAMIKVAQSVQLRRKFSQQAIIASRKYDWQKVVNTIADLIEQSRRLS